MSPLLKNVGLAFLAAFVTTLGAALGPFDKPPGLAVVTAAAGAALWAGGRAAVGYLKATYGAQPFKVDTEAKVVTKNVQV